VAKDIGDAAGVAEVDALDEHAVADHADAVAAEAGGIDIALNAVSYPHVQRTPSAKLAVEAVMHPIDAFLRTNLITAKAVSRHMTARGPGVILILSTAGSRHAPPGVLCYGTTCAATEAMTQRLAVHLGPSGVRVVFLRPPAGLRRSRAAAMSRVGSAGPSHTPSTRGTAPTALAEVRGDGSLLRRISVATRRQPTFRAVLGTYRT
jgi:NAD(P)-dependent dehydrogenase (short-subunit alcohol dehydrogenase family)